MNQVKPCVQVYIRNISTYLYLHSQPFHLVEYKKSIIYSQPVRMKQTCSEEEDLQHILGDLKPWLINRGYRAESFRREIQRVNSIDLQVLLEKRRKIQEGRVILVLAFNPSLYIIFDILKSAHWIVKKSPALKAILPKPPYVAFCNLETLHDELVCSN